MPKIEFKSRCDMGSERAMPVVSLMSCSPIFDTQKKRRKKERGEFITSPRPTGRLSKNGVPQQLVTEIRYYNTEVQRNQAFYTDL